VFPLVPCGCAACRGPVSCPCWWSAAPGTVSGDGSHGPQGGRATHGLPGPGLPDLASCRPRRYRYPRADTPIALFFPMTRSAAPRLGSTGITRRLRGA
jgi:hypothetical protein